MAREHITLGPTPSEEPCEQLGENYDQTKGRQEAQVFKDQLYRQFWKEFESRTNNGTVYLSIKGFDHEHGRYLEVVVNYDPEIEGDLDLAFRIEAEAAMHWDGEARKKLVALGILATA